MTDLILYSGNNKKKIATASVGELSYTLPGSLGNATSGESYKVGSVPANCVITSASLVVTTAFDSATTATVEVGTTDGGDEILSATNVKVTGATAAEGDIYVSALTSIYATPAIVGATTTGTVKVVINFTELDGYEGTFTE